MGRIQLRPLLATLLLASGVGTALLAIRALSVGQLRFSGMFGNLLLAWIPMLLSLLLDRSRGRRNPFFFASVGVLWLLFFPNCHYLISDLIHVRKFGQDGVYRWFDMLLFVSFAGTGTLLGSLSLYLVHLVVRERTTARVGWLFAVATLGVSAFGIYLGRFLRLNSWDPLVRPGVLGQRLGALWEGPTLREAAAFSATFWVVSLVIYLFVVALATRHGDPVDRSAR